MPIDPRFRTKLSEELIKLLKKEGKAKYDFGTFYLHKRKGYTILLRNGEKKRLKTQQTVFFRGSVKLKEAVKKMK